MFDSPPFMNPIINSGKLLRALGLDHNCPNCIPETLAVLAIANAIIRDTATQIEEDEKREMTTEEATVLLVGLTEGFKLGLRVGKSVGHDHKPFGASQN
jgi:hypothetical protein